MLAYLLALLVGMGSFALYMSAFFFPEIYRRYDLVWSGIGMFYALVLWICAGQLHGAVLLGQIAVVSLTGWFLWQNLELRRSLTPPDQRTPRSQADQSLATVISSQSQVLGDRAAQLPISQQVGQWVQAIADGGQGILASLQPRPTQPPAELDFKADPPTVPKPFVPDSPGSHPPNPNLPKPGSSQAWPTTNPPFGSADMDDEGEFPDLDESLD
ncbi:MAG: Ycf66 family protein [Synechococcales bacterium]|nr:Ycf66 family protein [Synechococcales bacterium]